MKSLIPLDKVLKSLNIVTLVLWTGCLWNQATAKPSEQIQIIILDKWSRWAKLNETVSICSFSRLISFFPIFPVKHFRVHYLGAGTGFRNHPEPGTLARESFIQCLWLSQNSSLLYLLQEVHESPASDFPHHLPQLW